MLLKSLQNFNKLLPYVNPLVLTSKARKGYQIEDFKEVQSNLRFGIPYDPSPHRKQAARKALVLCGEVIISSLYKKRANNYIKSKI